MTPGLTSAQLEARRGLATSSALSIYVTGRHRFITARDEYARRVHGVEPPGIGARGEVGLELEVALRRLAARRLGGRVHRHGRTLRHPTLPLVGHPDAFIVGRREGVETKVGGDREAWVDGPPDDARWQCLGYAMLAGWERVHLTVLLGSDLRIWPIERTSDTDAAIFEALDRWQREHIDPMIPPPLEADEPDDGWSLTFASLAPGEAIATGEALEVGELLADVVRARKGAQDGEDRLRARLARTMADDGLTGLRGPSWSAAARPAASGRVSLVFTAGAPMG